MPLAIKIKRLHPDAKLPSYAHPGDAGMDVFSIEQCVLQPGERKRIPTGIALELPTNYAALVWDKGSLGSTHGLKNLGGVMDAGYRGEYIITLVNLGHTPYTIEKGDKIAQILIQKVERPAILEVAELSETIRGTGAFGSTGKK